VHPRLGPVCKVTPVIIHGTVSPDLTGVALHGSASPETQNPHPKPQVWACIRDWDLMVQQNCSLGSASKP